MIGSQSRIFQYILWPFMNHLRTQIHRCTSCRYDVFRQTCRMASGLRGRKRIADSLSDKIDESDIKPPRKAPRSKGQDAELAQASAAGVKNSKKQSKERASRLRNGKVEVSAAPAATSAGDLDSLDTGISSTGILKENKTTMGKNARKTAKRESCTDDKTAIMQQVQIKQEPSWDEVHDALCYGSKPIVQESVAESKKKGRKKKNARTEKNAGIQPEPLASKLEPSSAETKTVKDKKSTGEVEPSEKLKTIGESPTRSMKIPDSGTPGSKFVGAHTSIAGGLYKAVETATSIGAKAFGLFLKSQRQWAAKPLSDEEAEKFKDAMEKAGYHPNSVLPHGCYLLNCGSPNAETLSKSRACLVDELQRCEKLGLTLYNFHPGSTCGEIEVEESLDRIAESINMAHAKTQYVVTVIENMCGQGNTVGGRFEELRGIIDRVKDKSRVGVCLDTCHAFAAGFDLASEEGFQAFVKGFDQTVGLEFLRGLHLNDSKGKLGCHLDRHENIGRGNLGLETFRRVMNEPSFCHIPMIIETPMGLSDEEEIRLLYSLCKVKEEPKK